MAPKFTYSGVPSHDDAYDGQASSNGNGNGAGAAAHATRPGRSSHHGHGNHPHRISLPKVTVCLLAAAVVVACAHLALRRPRGGAASAPAACTVLPAGRASSHDTTFATTATTARPNPTTDPGGPSAPWPRVAWLMSFPNSGTSYTMRLIQRMSNQTGASNYGKECDVDANGNNFPVYATSKDGPFYSQPSKRDLPTRYVVTKTHCGGYTTDSGPDKYIHTSRSFLVQCLTGNKITPKFDVDGKIVAARGVPLADLDKVHTTYDASLVQRAVHVVRDPFDNIVSRFHLEQHVHTKQQKTEWLERYPSTPEGFQRWCHDMDDAHKTEEKESRFLDPIVLEAFRGVPCHSEFYRYVQWHNLAIATTAKLNLPTLILNYERFESDFDTMCDELFNFLELSRNGSMTDFVPGKKYAGTYFSEEQRRRAMGLVRLMSEPETWEVLRRYDRDD